MDGEAQAGPIEDPDVVVEGQPKCIYYMFVDQSLDHVKVTGDRALLEQLISVAPAPVAAEAVPA